MKGRGAGKGAGLCSRLREAPEADISYPTLCRLSTPPRSPSLLNPEFLSFEYAAKLEESHWTEQPERLSKSNDLPRLVAVLGFRLHL